MPCLVPPVLSSLSLSQAVPPPRWSWAMNQGSSRICKPLWTWRLLVAADPHARRKLDRVKTQLWDLAG